MATNPGISRKISAADTNSTLAKGAPGELRGYFFSNQHASAWAWLKFYNKATAPTVGTDTPVITFGLPPASSGHIGGLNIQFDTGIGFGIVTDEADNNTTAPGAGDVVVNILVF